MPWRRRFDSRCAHGPAAEEKRRQGKQVAGCSECAPAAAFKARKPGALPEGAVVCFLASGGGQGCARKYSEAHLPRPAVPVS